MTKYEKRSFGTGMNINTQVVNGKCPTCEANSLLVSLHKTIFRCMHCGSDVEQKINGKISYIPIGGPIVLTDTRDLTNG
jgi:uncharacterized protein (DUF983 family)